MPNLSSNPYRRFASSARQCHDGSADRSSHQPEWEFKQGDNDESKLLFVSHLPTSFHLGLIHHGNISDPSIGKNELEAQWIG